MISSIFNSQPTAPPKLVVAQAARPNDAAFKHILSSNFSNTNSKLKTLLNPAANRQPDQNGPRILTFKPNPLQIKHKMVGVASVKPPDDSDDDYNGDSSESIHDDHLNKKYVEESDLTPIDQAKHFQDSQKDQQHNQDPDPDADDDNSQSVIDLEPIDQIFRDERQNHQVNSCNEPISLDQNDECLQGFVQPEPFNSLLHDKESQQRRSSLSQGRPQSDLIDDDAKNDDQQSDNHPASSLNDQNDFLAQDDESDDNDAQNALLDLNKEAIQDLRNEQPESALELLKRGESLLEQLTTEGREVDRNLIIVILYNQACCYQRINSLVDCASYLDGTIYNLEQKVTDYAEDDVFVQSLALEQNSNSIDQHLSQHNNSVGLSDPLDVGDQDQWSNEMPAFSQTPHQNNNLSVSEQVKKFNISSKLFKLRYLCKYHLQLCAVLSQLTRHREALHHGMLAGFYCQELIRNSHLLCLGYITKLQQQRLKQSVVYHNQSNGFKEDQASQSQQQQNQQMPYYVEENEKLLNLLITNCEPILRELTTQIDLFNKINKITDGFQELHNTVTQAQSLDRSTYASEDYYGGGADIFGANRGSAISTAEMLQAHRAEYCIKYDIDLIPSTTDTIIRNPSNPSSARGLKRNPNPQVQKPLTSQQTVFSYKSLKNNYLGLGNKTSNNATDTAQQPISNKQVKDEATPELYAERIKTQTNQQQYYSATTQSRPVQENGNSAQKLYPQQELRNNVKTILGVKDQDDWIFNLNIGNVMHLLPMCLEELNLHIDNSHELSRDAMLEKLVLLSVSYFCVGTELRFLCNQRTQQQNSKNKLKEQAYDSGSITSYSLNDSEMWHGMALETSATFLPSECPLVSHVITSFQKHHSPSMTAIPEDTPLTEPVKVLRPLNDVRIDQTNYHQIVKLYLPTKQAQMMTQKPVQKKEEPIQKFKKFPYQKSQATLNQQIQQARWGSPKPNNVASSKTSNYQPSPQHQHHQNQQLQDDPNKMYSISELEQMLGLNQPSPERPVIQAKAVQQSAPTIKLSQLTNANYKGHHKKTLSKVASGGIKRDISLNQIINGRSPSATSETRPGSSSGVYARKKAQSDFRGSTQKIQQGFNNANNGAPNAVARSQYQMMSPNAGYQTNAHKTNLKFSDVLPGTPNSNRKTAAGYTLANNGGVTLSWTPSTNKRPATSTKIKK